MSAIVLPHALTTALRIEGSELHIQMAGPNNLNWTYRVRFTDGATRDTLTQVGGTLPGTLDGLTSQLPRR